MPHHDLAVMLDALNQVTVVENSKKVKSTHTVRWVCVQGALRIIFPGPESPLKSKALVVSAPKGITGKVKLRKPSKKKFKYTAEITPLAGGGPHSVDPDLVVEDGGGGPKKKKAAKPATPKKKPAKK